MKGVRLGDIGRTCAQTPESVPPLDDDYVEHFRRLLVLEEQQMTNDMRLYRLYNVKLTRDASNAGIYRLHVPGLQEWRPPTVYGDRVRLRTEAPRLVAFDGVVYHVDRLQEVLAVSFALPPNIEARLATLKFHVDFLVNRSSLAAMLRALRVLGASGEPTVVEAVTRPSRLLQNGHRGGAVPSRPVALLDDALTDRGLNWEQRDAVLAALAQAQAQAQARAEAVVPGRMLVVFGPPGTGKTRTLVEIVLQLLAAAALAGHTAPALLLTAPSNQAVDILVNRLAPHVRPTEMLRLNGANARRRPGAKGMGQSGATAG